MPDKHTIDYDKYIKDYYKKVLLINILTSSLLCAVIFYNTGKKLEMKETQTKYQNSTLINNDKNYKMKDIYVVYNANNVYFCTRDIQKIAEGIDHYLNKTYDYYDITNGNKICSDYDDDFYIEKLLDFYDEQKMDKKNYQIDLDEATSDIDNDYLSSREPKPKIKTQKR